MLVRSCARRAHQLAASVLSNGVGPSRLPSASGCRCRPTAASTCAASSRSFRISSRQHEEVPTSSIAGDAARNARANKNTGLLEDVSDAAPTLEYLDSLKPRMKSNQNDQRKKRDSVNPFSNTHPKSNVEDKQWERTKSRIQASFTRDQLASLARAAKIPGAYNTKVRKDDIIRRIMIHRFGMQDSKERADREKREELEKRSVHIPFSPAELFLLLASGSGRVRQEAGKAQVVILPKAPKKEAAGTDAKLGFWLRGKDQGIDRMTQWVESFKQSIKTKEEQVVLSTETSDATTGELLPAELVRYISQLSRCFLEASPIQDGKVKLSLAYTDERDAQKAVLLLRQYQAQNVAAMQRVGAAAYCDNLVTLRQYSMLPFVPNEPVTWTKQVDDLIYGASSDVSFRVSHVPDLDAFSHISLAKLQMMKLTSWTESGETSFSEPFRALSKASAPSTADTDAVRDIECSATLGHVLFSSDGLTLADESLSEEQVLARMQDPLAAPRSGMWPIEHVTDWARGFRSRFGREASRFVPATLFRSQRNISLDMWLERQGYALVGKGAAESSAEKMVFVYQQPAAESSKLEIVLSRSQSASDAAEGAQGGWMIEHARWVTKAEADMMIPEKSADLRLSAKTVSTLEAEARPALEEALRSFVDAGSSAETVASTTEAVDEAAEADSEADANDPLGGETEIVERAEDVAERASIPSAGQGSKGLPQSILTLPSVGTLALESATRLTTQTYMHRSSIPKSKQEPTVAAPIPEAEVASAQSRGESVATSSETEAAASAQADAEEAVGFAENAAENEAASVSERDAVPQDSANPEPNAGQLNVGTDEAAAPSPLLIRELSQDLVTKTTTESLRLTWQLSSAAIPKWTSIVDPISALIDRHDPMIR